MAAKRGRKIKQHHLFINSPARRDRLMQERAKLKGASTNAHLKENSDTMLRYGKEFIENLDFFEVGVMHQPFPIKEVEKTSYLDCIALMRDPRDAATSYGFSSSWPRPNPSMDDWETAGKFEFQNNVNFFIDNYLEPLSDHFVEVQKSESLVLWSVLKTYMKMLSGFTQDYSNGWSWSVISKLTKLARLSTSEHSIINLAVRKDGIKTMVRNSVSMVIYEEVLWELAKIYDTK